MLNMISMISFDNKKSKAIHNRWLNFFAESRTSLKVS